MISTTDRFSIDRGREQFYGGKVGFTDDGHFIIQAFTTPPPEPRGTYFTSLAISPPEYREKHPTAASYWRQEGLLTVYNDWGGRHTIHGPNGFLDELEADCIKGGLKVNEHSRSKS